MDAWEIVATVVGTIFMVIVCTILLSTAVSGTRVGDAIVERLVSWIAPKGNDHE